jgi:hypothetical protein
MVITNSEHTEYCHSNASVYSLASYRSFSSPSEFSSVGDPVVLDLGWLHFKELHDEDKYLNVYEPGRSACPTPRIVGVDSTGSPRLERCERNACSGCVVGNAVRIAGAVHLSVPDFSFMLTQVGDTAKEIRERMSVFCKLIRRWYPKFQMAWAAEYFLNSPGAHIHGYFHGGPSELSESVGVLGVAARRSGMGPIFGVKEIPNGEGPSYFVYPMKCVADLSRVDGFHFLNSSPSRYCLIHATNKFWRSGPDGSPIRRDEAEVIAFRRYGARNSWKWSSSHD